MTVDAKGIELNRYLELTRESRKFWEESRDYLPGGDSRNSIFWKPYPIFITSASGSHIIDADNVDRIDFINTMTTMILGHGPAPVIDAVQTQLHHGLAYNAPNLHQVRLAKMLCDRVPGFDKIRFTNSGTEATLNTLRAARAFTGKSKFAKAEGGYHGTHDSVSVSIRIDPNLAGAGDNPKALASSAGLADGVVEQVVVLPFNDTHSSKIILERNASDLAAVIVEPMLGSVGMVPANHDFLQMLRQFTKDNGIILIFDEVISFRVGSGGCQEYYGITPDMTSLGKIIGGGFAVGAFGGRDDIMDLYDPTTGPQVGHAGTFNANPITMLAGSVTLEQLTPEVFDNLSEKTQYLKQGIREVCAKQELPVQVTGLGSLFGIHFTDTTINNYRDITAENTTLRDQVFLGLMNEGILMAPNLVGAISTAISDTEVDDYLNALDTVLRRNL